MTRLYAVVIDGERAAFFAHADEDQASEQEHALMAEGYESRAIGDIDGDAYLIVYRKPKKATKRAKGYNGTTQEEKGPQNEEQAHRCGGCPECAVLFDKNGYHGSVPDRNSKTCRSCEHCREASQ